MITRILSALVMAPVAIAAIWLGSGYFLALVIIVGIAAAFEWYRLISDEGIEGVNTLWLLLGFVYIGVACLVLVWLRNIEPQGFQIILWFFVVIWTTDIRAYFSGKAIGGPKLAPGISPNKTWAGFFGGLVLAIVSSVILMNLADSSMFTFGLSMVIAACIVLSIVGQFGDLLESSVKRKLGVKDSGSLIPGHGGVLDRIDAILLAAPVAGIIPVLLEFGDASWK